MFECAGDKPIEYEEESTKEDIGNDEFDLKEENCTKDELVEESVEKIFMSWSQEEIGHYYQLMCLHNDIELITLDEFKGSLWDICMPTLQYLEEKIWMEVIGIKDIENLNDDKQIEECFAVEVDHNGLKVKKKVKMKNQKYFWYKVRHSKPSNDETKGENDAIEIIINDWFAKAKKIDCNGLDAEILYFEENKYRGVAEQKEFRLFRYKVKMKKWLKPQMKQELKKIKVKMKIKQKTKFAYFKFWSRKKHK